MKSAKANQDNKADRKTSTSSFVTAKESVPDSHPSPQLASITERVSASSSGNGLDGWHNQPDNHDSPHETASFSVRRTSSNASLLKHDHDQSIKHDSPTDGGYDHRTPGAFPDDGQLLDGEIQPIPEDDGRGQGQSRPGLVRFDIPNDNIQRERHVRLRVNELKKQGTLRNLGRSNTQDGRIAKMENMLVRIEFTSQEIPADFGENDREKIESRIIDRWKEFMVVCRESTDEESPFVLELYRTRVIPAIEKTHVKRCSYEIPLNRQTCKVSLFSSVDKTMAVSSPKKKGHLFYIMQSRSGASSMEWYTFLRNILGWSRSQVLKINVPDLAVNLRLENPFGKIESSRDLAQAAAGDEEAMKRTMVEEQVAAANIIQRCLAMLQKSEFDDMVKSWVGSERVGLAWKRYDRLEWVHGANESKMYGTIGMEKSHELELRLKQHYPTASNDKKGQTIEEPPPVEGFLIRLTSQKGTDQRLGKLFFKRLYFSTHSQFLVFNRPAKSDPPPPPKLPMRENSSIPSSQQIADKIPLIYAVNPFPERDSNIEWLSGSLQEQTVHDHDAHDESQRNMGLVMNCDGVVNLCNVKEIREMQRGAAAADSRMSQGPGVDPGQDVRDTRRDDGTTKQTDDQRTFELVLRNDLVIRLQAFDMVTRNEWMKRLQSLVDYWKLRTAADMRLFKSVRAQNLSRLAIDEESEAYAGQFARKWEVTNSFASPELYHMCSIGCCRSITLAGNLFRRPRMHGAFQRNLVILAHGRLLLFRDTLRKHNGRLLKHIHHERIGALDLSESYVYSGLITANDLLYTSTSSIDRAHPGRHALPRMYLEDGWSSIDEDTMTCFVVWHGKRSSWFQSQGAEEPGRGMRRLKKVRSLGKEGKSVVFKARSRAERDHWVMAIGMEIERLAMGDDVRVVGDEKQGETGQSSGTAQAAGTTEAGASR